MTIQQTITVILVDDHPVVRDGYRRLLGLHGVVLLFALPYLAS